MKIQAIEPSARIFEVQRKNLYPFLTKEEMRGWMEDEGPLRIRWYAVKENGKTIGVAAWEVYDIHQYEENGPRIAILDLKTLEIEESVRGKGLGFQLFKESLKDITKELEAAGFIVGGLQIETTTASGFYEKALARLKYRYNTETRIMGGYLYKVFWVPLL